MTGEGEGNKGTFFCLRSNFCAITRLETFATQAKFCKVYRTESKQEIMGPILVAGEHLNLKGTRREALLAGDKIEWYRE